MAFELQVPLVHEDLNYGETILEIGNTLDILDQAMKNVFKHINTSMNRTQQSVQAVEQRNQVVKEKINQLKNIQKSVTIFSSSKYPYVNNSNYQIAFQANPKRKFKKAVRGANDKIENSGDIENKLKFYHVKTNDMLRKNVELVCDETLGKLPSNIDSITSCMLFNTCENVYDKYTIIDPLSSNKNVTKDDAQNIKQLKMEDAPKSLNQEEDLLAKKQAYVYSPSLEDVPFIELPADLPDLMGFADDFRYTGDDDVMRPNTGNAPVAPTQRPSIDLTPNIRPEVTAQQSTGGTTSVTMATPPPPPPLPPPSPELKGPAKPEPATPPVPTQTSLHANLMEAIRSAGGKGKANLKSVNTASSEPEQVKTAAATGGDLMSDLHAKLLLRRKGISGQVKESSSLMDKLLANIPPPPRPGAGSSSSDENNETENDAEWDE